jgi:SAM-dependent methyltransferase
MVEQMRASVTWPLRVPRSAEEVWSASYPDFVAMINQTNVMPGAYATVNTWALYSMIGASSSVLDVACTTGFSSRELARLTGCRALGFDLSPDAVALATFNHACIDPSLDLRYIQADGYEFETAERFTHVVIGATLGFFPEPRAMAERLVGFLQDGGYILASPFYCEHRLPDDVAALRRDIFGIAGPMESWKDLMSYIPGLIVVREEHHRLRPETDLEIEHYCQSTVDRVCHQAGIAAPDVKTAMVERLRLVKLATNRLREHQRYAVLVLQLRRTEYPRRYVELF